VQWRKRLYDLLARGDAPDLDPDAPVEVAEVPLHDGPRLLAAVQAGGVDAVGIESFDVVTETRTRMRIMVPRSQLAVARQLVDAAG
jgi:hypothetical protein